MCHSMTISPTRKKTIVRWDVSGARKWTPQSDIHDYASTEAHPKQQKSVSDELNGTIQDLSTIDIANINEDGDEQRLVNISYDDF